MERASMVRNLLQQLQAVVTAEGVTEQNIHELEALWRCALIAHRRNNVARSTEHRMGQGIHGGTT